MQCYDTEDGDAAGWRSAREIQFAFVSQPTLSHNCSPTSQRIRKTNADHILDPTSHLSRFAGTLLMIYAHTHSRHGPAKALTSSQQPTPSQQHYSTRLHTRPRCVSISDSLPNFGFSSLRSYVRADQRACCGYSLFSCFAHLGPQVVECNDSQWATLSCTYHPTPASDRLDLFLADICAGHRCV